MLFYKQLATILDSGITILQGLKLLSQRQYGSLVNVCLLLNYHLQQGSTLTQAMQRQPRFFDALALALIGVGEKSGQLPTVMEELYEYYRQVEELKGFLWKTALYPCFLLATAGCALLFFLLYVLPLIAATVISLNAAPSPFLQFVLRFNVVVKGHWYLLLLSLVLALELLYHQRQALQELLWRLPYLEKVQRLVSEVRFCRLLALMLESGLNILSAIPMAAQAVPSKLQVQRLKLFELHLKQGMDISSAASSIPQLFSSTTLELLIVGATTGYLPQMLNEAARLQEQVLREKLDKFKEVLGPSLLLVAALLTAAVICTALQPLFQLITAIPQS